MASPIFSDPPSAELLQWLARGSLKQLLLRSVRLWVWLCFLYGDEGSEVNLPEPFTYADWRDAFFSPTHPKGEAIPVPHDRTCRCSKTTAEWLFTPGAEISLSLWRKSLKQHDSLPDSLDELLETALFRVTRRTLYEDLKILCKLGWIRRIGQGYCRVTTFPDRPLATKASNSVIVHPDLAAIADNLSQQINGWQRFFLHVEYVVPYVAIDQVDDWQTLLRQIWEQTPIPPVRLSYYSAKLVQRTQSIVYPVCIYYVQRAPYLCAWGQTPEGDPDAMDWRNYRLDRIDQIVPLIWKDKLVPLPLYQSFQKQQLPNPSYIEQCMADAWGFDFYRPKSMMVLRFERWFSDGYVQGTVRHDTFEQISYEEAGEFIQQQAKNKTERQELLKIWRGRSPQDHYYKAYYRDGDPNIMLRLRGWRPKMEVLLPYHLRQRIAAEVEKERQFYQYESCI